MLRLWRWKESPRIMLVAYRSKGWVRIPYWKQRELRTWKRRCEGKRSLGSRTLGHTSWKSCSCALSSRIRLIKTNIANFPSLSNSNIDTELVQANTNWHWTVLRKKQLRKTIRSGSKGSWRDCVNTKKRKSRDSFWCWRRKLKGTRRESCWIGRKRGGKRGIWRNRKLN